LEPSSQESLNIHGLRYFLSGLYGIRLSANQISPGLTELIRIALNKLPDRELSIILLRFGLVDGIYKTLDEVSVLLVPPVSKQAVSPFLRRAVHRLRSHGVSVDIRVWLKHIQDEQQ
jgi:DNA-directed RNA polymerase sigma subunit (sigma70/sigma32)